jgi:hypothetical protein
VYCCYSDESVLSRLLVGESAELARLLLFCEAAIGDLHKERHKLLDEGHELG